MQLRGAFRIPSASAPVAAAARPASVPAASGRDFGLSSETTPAAVPQVTARPAAASEPPQWLSDAGKLIPGEALTGYLSLQILTRAAQQPQNVGIVLALAFLVVTIVTRWFGSQDPTAIDPQPTTQPAVVVIAALSYVALVYATGGQVAWHDPIADQQLYGQIAAGAIGALGPTVARRFGR
jgi:hypothetical protein